jgi:peptidoglycan/LPS O-acetylase OafA/YrhL
MTKRLLLLNGLAALMVVLNHASFYGFRAMFYWVDLYRPVTSPNFDQIGSFAYYFLFISHQLAELAIPAFLFVSGFFITFTARGEKSVLGWNTVFSRVKKFIVPFLFWTVTLILLERIFPIDLKLIGKTSSLQEAITLYYYIPLAIQYYLLSPWIVPLAKKYWLPLLVGAAILQLGILSLRIFFMVGLHLPGIKTMISLTPLWFFPSNIFYFVVGVVAGLHIKEFSQLISRYKWVLLIAAVTFLALTVVEYQVIAWKARRDWLGMNFAGMARVLFAITFVLSFLAFDRIKLPFSDLLTQLGGKSLGIYLVNTPAIYFAALVVIYTAPWMLGSQLIWQTALIVFGLGLPLLLMFLVSKSPARRAYRFLFG